MKVAFIFLLLGFVHAEPDEDMLDFEMIGYSTNLDDPQYRLLDNVIPTYMYVDLDVYLPESRFNGLVQVDVEVSPKVSGNISINKILLSILITVFIIFGFIMLFHGSLGSFN